MCGKHTVQQLGAAGAAVGNSQKLLIFYPLCAVCCFPWKNIDECWDAVVYDFPLLRIHKNIISGF